MTGRLSGKGLTHWIIERLQILREKTGLTAEDFAAKVGIGVGYIYKIERGESEPSVQVINDWLTVCGKDLATFFLDLAHGETEHPEWAPWHDRLNAILETEDDFIVKGIQLNLIAVAREAELFMRKKLRAQAKARASPLPERRAGDKERAEGQTQGSHRGRKKNAS